MTTKTYLQIGAVLALIGAMFAGCLKLQAWKADLRNEGLTAGRAEVQADWDRAKLQAIEKREVNREVARKVEIRYVEGEAKRTEFLVVTQKELSYETKNLESCRLDAGDIGLLNKVASTAREN